MDDLIALIVVFVFIGGALLVVAVALVLAAVVGLLEFSGWVHRLAGGKDYR